MHEYILYFNLSNIACRSIRARRISIHARKDKSKSSVTTVLRNQNTYVLTVRWENKNYEKKKEKNATNLRLFSFFFFFLKNFLDVNTSETNWNATDAIIVEITKRKSVLNFPA